LEEAEGKRKVARASPEAAGQRCDSNSFFGLIQGQDLCPGRPAGRPPAAAARERRPRARANSEKVNVGHAPCVRA